MNSIIEWLAVFLTVAAAILTSLGYVPENIWLFNIASVVWVIHSFRVKRTALLFTNLSLLAVYTFGVLRNM